MRAVPNDAVELARRVLRRRDQYLTEGVLPTVQGEIVEVTLDPIAINGAGVAIPDVLATNGVVHVIDAVLTPPEGL